jgi:hypothetical protein
MYGSREHDFQSRVLKQTALIESARKRDWSKLPEIFEYISGARIVTDDPKYAYTLAFIPSPLMGRVRERVFNYAMF